MKKMVRFHIPARTTQMSACYTALARLELATG